PHCSVHEFGVRNEHMQQYRELTTCSRVCVCQSLQQHSQSGWLSLSNFGPATACRGLKYIHPVVGLTHKNTVISSCCSEAAYESIYTLQHSIFCWRRDATEGSAVNVPAPSTHTMYCIPQAVLVSA
ncbi:unnamed protein product, partial [Ectocarpus sp. 12 AP-2014]